MKNWVQIVGYHHEVLHTGVLRALLEDQERGVVVATNLTGASVVAVRNVHAEQKIPGEKGRADLVAELELEDGLGRWLAVETKVDSDGTREQLINTANRPNFGVLLALGLTALKLRQADIGPDPRLKCWRAVDPASWLETLNSARTADDLNPYVEEVAREAAEQEEACCRACEQGPPAPISNSRRQDGLVEDFAWLTEVRERLDHREWWWTKTAISGPLMGWWPSEWNQRRTGGDVSRYVEFMCSGGQRRLCLKVGAQDPATLREERAELAAVANDLGWREAPHPSPRARTCTVASLDMTRMAADQTAATTRKRLADLHARLS